MQASSAASEHCKQSGSKKWNHHQKYLVPLQVTSANLCYMHSWLLVGDTCTSIDRVCKVPLQTNLNPTHHLVGGWQGQVRRCLKTIHAINLFAAKWLPINCFTLTKDGLQTLNIPCLRAKSGSNCLDLLHWSYLKVSLSCGNSMSLSWILEMPLAPFLCHLPLVPCYSVKQSLTYIAFHLHSWRPQRFLFSYCPWCFTCLVFWFRCGFTQMLLAFQRGERLHTSLRTKTRIQPHISPLAEQTDKGSRLIKYQ